jgi:hypothetical protein
LPLNHALESNNAEMTKRLKYTKDILTHMLNNNNKAGPTTPGSGLGGTGGPTSATGSSRPGTITSAVSTKRSLGAGSTIELGSGNGIP